MKMLVVILGLLCSTCLMQIAFAHPADGCTPADEPSGYGHPSFTSFGDLKFDYDYLPWNQLTAAERYIVAGGTSTKGGYLMPWILKINESVIFYNENNGIVPSQYSPDILASLASSSSKPTTQQLAWFSSPLTNKYPDLTAKDFTPGCIYIRELDQEEIQQATMQDDVLRMLLQGQHTDQNTGETREMKLLTGVYYYRVYGVTNVLEAGITYAWDYVD
jgi:hypothetical protein